MCAGHGKTASREGQGGSGPRWKAWQEQKLTASIALACPQSWAMTTSRPPHPLERQLSLPFCPWLHPA